jgi:hypothetical protein
VTRDEFLERLSALAMGQGAFAHYVGVHPSSVYHWGAAGGPFPKWVDCLLTAWEENKRLKAQLIA